MAADPQIFVQGPAGDEATTVRPAPERFKLLNRHRFGSTLVRIGAHWVPRRSLILALSETVLLIACLVAATFLRFHNVRVGLEYLGQPENWFRFGFMALTCQLSLYYSEVYEVRVASNRALQLVRAMAAMGVAIVALSILYYLLPPIRLERGIAVLASFMSIVTIVAWRLTLDKTKVFSHPLERVLIMGTGQQGMRLAEELLRRPQLQYKIVGFLDEKNGNIGKPLATPGIIGGISEVEEICARENVDRLVISLAERRGVMPIRELATLRLQGLPIEDAQAVYERLTGRVSLDDMHPSWLFLSEGFRKSHFMVAMKRATDILVSSVLIVLTFPVMLLVAAAIWLEDGSPVLFRQERVGLGGRVFRINKFRSMRVSNGTEKPSWTADGDPRITRVGAIIRKFRFDELPQLFNILNGEMSLVGPRPEVPYFCELLDREVPFFNQRHSVRPGLTGWAQIRYIYGASLEQAKTKFEYDLFYIKHLSVLFDLTIIIETAKVVLMGKGAK
ncbi:MAG TPA: TIGR03013 family XrtA/PEP-CTERM system glycosyltransferase [Candidatus Angelobacter sp.]|nr:TIGR03013 family XrtA/PEP-CTERM system glycosyltransferase [Candidatus Angelobacter sp.]